MDALRARTEALVDFGLLRAVGRRPAGMRPAATTPLGAVPAGFRYTLSGLAHAALCSWSQSVSIK
jgi:hypothetical protein